MRKLMKFVSVCALVLCLACAGWAETVSALRVEGNNEVVSEHILRAVKTRVGDQLDQQTVMDDIQAIYDLGFFSYVDAKAQMEGNQLVLTYVVTENPTITEIRFQGNTILKEEQLK